MTKEQALKQLKKNEEAVAALEHASGLLYYDGVTVAPSGSVEVRADTLGQLSEMLYRIVTSPEQAEALNVLWECRDELTPVDKRKVEMLCRQYDRTRKIPMEEMVEYDMHLSKAEAVWHEAKQNNDFASFEPYLQKTFDTVKRFSGYTDPEKDPYDAALNTYEKGLTQEKCDEFFAALRTRIVPLIAEVKSAPQIDDEPLHRIYPKEKQMKFSDFLVDIMDVDRKYFIIGETEHPFTTNFTKHDVRITTHYHEDLVASSLYSVVHETGHALYELNTADELCGTCLGTGVSMAIHESQSRFYENIIGRSRPFADLIFPYLKKEFPEQLRDVDGDRFYRMINRSEPSLIRTEADELTYCLHVMVRYELEKRMIRGEIRAADLPGEWNRLYREYLGVEVPDDKRGVLQDSHWAGGNVGYFPSYALGSAYGAQYLAEMKKDLDVDAAIRSGKLTKINDWLREKVWKYGCMLDPGALFEQTCGKFDPMIFADYLEKKYTEIYGL